MGAGFRPFLIIFLLQELFLSPPEFRSQPLPYRRYSTGQAPFAPLPQMDLDMLRLRLAQCLRFVLPPR